MAVDSCEGFVIFCSSKWHYVPEYRQDNLKSHKIKRGSVFFNLSSKYSLNYGTYHSDTVPYICLAYNSEFQGRENYIQINSREAN